MSENLFEVFLGEHGLELAGSMALVTPFLENFIGHNEGIVEGDKAHRTVDSPVVFHLHAFRFFHFRVCHVALHVTGTYILDLINTHVTHDEVLVAHFGIAQAFVAGTEKNVTALALHNRVDSLHIVAAHQTIGAGFIVRFVKKTLFIFIQLVADRHFGLMASFDIKQTPRHVAAVVLPTFKIDLCFWHFKNPLNS